MSTKEIKFVNVDEKLGKDKFFVDEENAHIVLCDEPDRKEFRKLVKACPANLYKEADDGGTCRVLCGDTILKKWEFPQGTFGVEFRFG